jgi:hypothetical protein
LASIFNLTPMEIVVIGAIIGIAFALPLTTDEDGVFANVLDLAAEMIFIIAAQRVLISDKRTAAQAESSTENIQRQINELEGKVAQRSAYLNRSTSSANR